MERNVDYSVRPRYEDFILNLDGTDLRFLLSRTCPSADSSAAGKDAVELLMSQESAHTALSFCEPDVLDVAHLIHILADSATLETLAEVAYWASDADVMAHDTPKGVDRKRYPVGKQQLKRVLERGQRQGLVWEEPAGVWHVPSHISRIFPTEPSLDFHVADLVANLPEDMLARRMERLGLDPEGTTEQRIERLAGFLCDPRKVRALIATAPVDIRNELRWMAIDEKFLPSTMWSELRIDAVRWAEERLLLAIVESPSMSAFATEEMAEAAPPEIARIVGAVALALKEDMWTIRKPHPTEPFPATLESKELDDASVAAVAFASAFMDAAGSDDGRLKDPLHMYEESSLLWIQDFAASIGASAFAAPWIVEMLVNAGLIYADSGHPTPRALEHWYNADASTRWAYLVAGFLVGRGPWHGEFPWVTMGVDDFSHATLAYGYPYAACEVVSLAAQLEEDQKFYGCCVESHMAWQVENLCARNGADGEAMVGWLLEQAGILGILYRGHASWQAMAVMYALHDIWLTDQHIGAQRMAELIAEYAAGKVATAEAVQIARLFKDAAPNERLSATLEGVASNQVALALDFIGDREKCAETSRWIISEDSLRRAVLAVDGDVEVLFSQLGPLVNSSMKLVIYAELVRITKTEKLQEIYEREAFEPDSERTSRDDGTENAAESENSAAQDNSDDPDDPDDPQQLALF
ncbi:MAG: hypothetical protein Q4E11_03890 [Corynebacterium sp.]|uniref:hypothetical protein n=1 Tax=Corynebacterium sp. TaxID=1720 RepID=UPI0026DB0AC8|nr:hypothetical protein [Corynebacterium sp.]MDO5029711.1 hypothetical protein [Corynebacterium sp.]